MLGEGSHGIDVIIPARGRADFVARALDSVERQTLSPSNVIVVDDGSPTPLKEALGTRFDGFCTVLRHEPGKGGGYARNIGIEAASSDWVAFLDSDDWWDPGHLETADAWLRQHDACAVVGAYRAVFKPTGEIVYRSPVTGGPIRDFAEYMFCTAGLCRTSTFVVRRDQAQRVGFDNGGHEDWDFMLRLARAGEVLYNSSVTVNVDHDAAARLSHSRSPDISFRFLAKHYSHLTRRQRNGFRLRAARNGALHAQRDLVWSLVRGLESPVSLRGRAHALTSVLLGLHPSVTKAARIAYVALSGMRKAVRRKSGL